jgi:hypothetical protein
MLEAAMAYHARVGEELAPPQPLSEQLQAAIDAAIGDDAERLRTEARRETYRRAKRLRRWKRKWQAAGRR